MPDGCGPGSTLTVEVPLHDDDLHDAYEHSSFVTATEEELEHAPVSSMARKQVSLAPLFS